MGCSVAVLRRLATVILLLGMSVFTWSMLAGTLPENDVTIHVESPARRLIAERVKHLELMAKEKGSDTLAEELDLNYVSRRRIPTGPDPIHNRYFLNILSDFFLGSYSISEMVTVGNFMFIQEICPAESPASKALINPEDASAGGRGRTVHPKHIKNAIFTESKKVVRKKSPSVNIKGKNMLRWSCSLMSNFGSPFRLCFLQLQLLTIYQ